MRRQCHLMLVVKGDPIPPPARLYPTKRPYWHHRVMTHINKHVGHAAAARAARGRLADPPSGIPIWSFPYEGRKQS